MRADIAAFWERTRGELDKVPIDAVVTPAPEQSAREYNTWGVVMRSFGDIKVRAWWSVPKDLPPGRGLPCIISIPGYAGTRPIQSTLLDLGYAVLNIYPRAQGESIAEWDLAAKNKLTYKPEDKEEYYYRGCYMDLIRAVDFVLTRPEVDPSRIGAWGRSQGGGLAIALAALDHRINAAVGEEAFLSNFPLAAKVGASPYTELANYLEQHAEQRDALLANLEFFDPMNLSDAVRCPTLMNIGLKDPTCPYDTVFPTFANIPGLKSLIVYPDLAHDTCTDFNVHALNWLKRYIG